MGEKGKVKIWSETQMRLSCTRMNWEQSMHQSDSMEKENVELV